MWRSLRAAWRRLLYGPPIVVVSGLPRSGTSMAMKMLAAGGLPVVADDQRTADEDNPKGYFEDERVKALGEMTDKAWLRESRGKAIKVISYLLKDLPRDNNYKVLFLRRHLREVLLSQAKMLARRGEANEVADAQMLEIYESHLWRVDYLFKHAPHLERLDLQYDEVVSDPRRAAERIDAFLGGGLDAEQMAAAVDASLYRNRQAS
jgi:hypothetical protein